MLEAKKTNKINYGPSKIKKFLWKRNDLPKFCKKLSKQILLIKNAYKFHWKNAHSTVLQNAWSQKNNTLIEKQD